MANETINWYPGHMKKATRMMEDSLRLVDAVVELRDARIPNSSRNPDVERIVGSKPRLIVLNRADQADAAATAGLAKTTSLLVWPMRPTKLRFVVETARSPAHITPICPPRQGPQVGVETAQPAVINVSTRPSCIAWR